MPPDTTLRTFIEAVKTQETNTTKVLGRIFANPGQYQGTPFFNWLNQPDALSGNAIANALAQPVDQPLPQQVRTDLLALSQSELNHLDDWDPQDKEQRLRPALVTAISANRPVHFRWQVHPDNVEQSDINPAGAAGQGAITIKFLSPRANVKLSALNFGDVKVDV